MGSFNCYSGGSPSSGAAGSKTIYAETTRIAMGERIQFSEPISNFKNIYAHFDGVAYAVALYRSGYNMIFNCSRISGQKTKGYVETLTLAPTEDPAAWTVDGFTTITIQKSGISISDGISDTIEFGPVVAN